MVRGDTRLGEPLTMGMVRVSLKGTARAATDGNPVPSMTAPNIGEANAALNRAAQVMGADAVLKPASDYRRAALAGGALVSVEVQAWGTAVRYEAAPGVESEPRSA